MICVGISFLSLTEAIAIAIYGKASVRKNKMFKSVYLLSVLSGMFFDHEIIYCFNIGSIGLYYHDFCILNLIECGYISCLVV